MAGAEQILKLGQSIWYDNISRELLRNGELERLVNKLCIRGLTSNPTIFEKAVQNSSVYDDIIFQLGHKGLSADQIIEEVMIADIAEAADLLKPTFEESEGVDGYVSIEVSPLLAADSAATVIEGKRLFARLNRQNIMIKVPGTEAGLAAVYELLREGINVNVTLLFSVENYRQVAQAYIDALQWRLEQGLDICNVASVASFFVSRVDTVIDALLESSSFEIAKTAKAPDSFFGKAAIANTCLAYGAFLEIFSSPAYRRLEEMGARKQRPLWASTSTKNPSYGELIYVENLIDQDTVNTVPHSTLLALTSIDSFLERVESGNIKLMREQLCSAASMIASLKEQKIDFSKICVDLQKDGVEKFAQSFLSLRNTIMKKLNRESC